MALQERLKLAILGSKQPGYKIAALAGISETQLSRIVQGRREPHFHEKAALARALNVSLNELFEGVLDKPRGAVSISPEAAFAARALLKNALVDIDFMYPALTKTEKDLVTKTQFEELVKWLHAKK
jgi:transcriptional regulator with XRE-family HTH domain